MELTVADIIMLETYRDTLTGFTGVVTCKCEYAFEVGTVLLENEKEQKWITVNRLEKHNG